GCAFCENAQTRTRCDRSLMRWLVSEERGRTLPRRRRLLADPDRDQVLARDADAELGRELRQRVKGDEVALERPPAVRIEALGQHLRRTIAGHEPRPRGAGVGLAIVGDAVFEAELEVLAEELANPLAPPPIERRR